MLQAAFVPIFLYQKITKPNYMYREKLWKHFCMKKGAHKMLKKLTPSDLPDLITSWGLKFARRWQINQNKTILPWLSLT